MVPPGTPRAGAFPPSQLPAGVCGRVGGSHRWRSSGAQIKIKSVGLLRENGTTEVVGPTRTIREITSVPNRQIGKTCGLRFSAAHEMAELVEYAAAGPSSSSQEPEPLRPPANPDSAAAPARRSSRRSRKSTHAPENPRGPPTLAMFAVLTGCVAGMVIALGTLSDEPPAAAAQGGSRAARRHYRSPRTAVLHTSAASAVLPLWLSRNGSRRAVRNGSTGGGLLGGFKWPGFRGQPALRLALGQRAVPCNCTAAAACRSNSAVRSPRSPPPPLSRRSPPPPLVRVRVAMRRMEAYRSYTVCAEAACGVCSNPPAPPAPAARQNSGQPQNVSAAKNHGHHKV